MLRFLRFGIFAILKYVKTPKTVNKYKTSPGNLVILDPFWWFFLQIMGHFRPYKTISYHIWICWTNLTYLDQFGHGWTCAHIQLKWLNGWKRLKTLETFKNNWKRLKQFKQLKAVENGRNGCKVENIWTWSIIVEKGWKGWKQLKTV